jgi:hypothetical protein
LFSKRPHAENKALYKDLATLIGESGFVGCASAVSLPDFAEILAPTTIDDPYYLCFLSTVIGQASDASVCIPRGTIAFTFDRNPPVEFNASALYDGIVHRNNDPNAHYVEAMAEDLSFATRRTIGIQAADLLEYEAMKRMDNEYGPVRRPKRRSFEAIFKNRAIRIRLFNRSWCLNAKRFAMTTEYPKDDYMRWLHSQERRDDNLSNRLRFQAEKGALAELGGET